eukprot:12214834-Alexandrium_andersonii.AAC.1
MSASLVGSEMCIRDSLRLHEVWPRQELVGAVRVGALILFSHPALVLPVSYTHLTLPTICSV